MNRLELAASLCVMFALLTACSAAGSGPSGSRALSPSTPIPAGTQAPAAPAGPPLAKGQQSGDLRVWLYSAPAQPVEGTAQLHTFLTDSAGKPVNDVQVTYDTDMTNMSHGLYLVSAEPASEGHYVGNVHFSMPGPWRVITIVERTGQQPVRLRFEFRVKSQ
jgi:hypothetical protein